MVAQQQDATVSEIKEQCNLQVAKQMAEDDININKKMGKNGAELFQDNDTIMTHCNAGALATVGYGTALGVIRATKESGKNIKVIATETRPIQQGSRLTAFRTKTRWDRCYSNSRYSSWLYHGKRSCKWCCSWRR